MFENWFCLLNVGDKFIFSGYAYEKVGVNFAKKIASGKEFYFGEKAKVINFK